MKQDKPTAVFVSPNPGGSGLNDATILPPLGAGYLAAMLEKNGFACTIVDAYVQGLSPAQVVDRIPKDASLVGISVNSFTYNASREIAHAVKLRNPETTVVIGGPVPTTIPHTVLEDFRCDGLVRGEAEFAIVRIMENLAAGSTAFDDGVIGAVYRGLDGMTNVSNPVERITDLDRIPFPAFHLLPPLKTYRSRAVRSPSAPIITTRGCPYGCTFCSKDVFGRRVTFRSAANVLEEIDVLHRKYGVRQIDILDDNFSLNRKRMDEILDGLISAYKGKLALNLQSGIRTELLEEDLIVKMKHAGVTKLGIGIESADEEVLKLCHKESNLAQIENAVRWAKKHGIAVFGFFIIGLPGETEEAFRKTLDYARKLDLDVANFCMAIPFVGTELYMLVQKNGRFLIDTSRNIDAGFYAGRVFYEYEGLTEQVVLDRYKKAYTEFYNLKKKLKLILKIRSVTEAKWLLGAAMSIMKGALSGARPRPTSL